MSNKFRKNLKSFFKYIGEIGQLEPTWEDELPRIRIAVLDSGVDDGESEINQAIKYGQINKKRSKTFIQKPGDTEESWRTDTYGHGTKVTQLLLETAPAAEIFVCKISTGKVINQEYMPGIAEVSWLLSLKQSAASCETPMLTCLPRQSTGLPPNATLTLFPCPSDIRTTTI